MKKDKISGWDYNQTHYRLLEILTENRDLGKKLTYSLIISGLIFLVGAYGILNYMK